MKYFFALIISLWATTSYAQQYNVLKNIDEFKNRAQKESANTESLVCIFKQTKYLGLLSEKIVSAGNFSFKSPDKVWLQYTSPVKYIMKIESNNITIESGGKVNSYDAGSNKIMKQMQTLIAACMTGNLDMLDKDYKISYFQNNDHYKVTVIPTGMAKAYMSQIDIVMERSDLTVHSLRLIESSEDYTEYVFSNKRKTLK